MSLNFTFRSRIVAAAGRCPWLAARSFAAQVKDNQVVFRPPNTKPPPFSLRA